MCEQQQISAKRQKLREELLALSEADEWETARSEWIIIKCELSSEFHHCVCSQAIKELITIENTINHKQAVIGNECVFEFLELKTNTFFTALKRITANPRSAKPNAMMINMARKLGYIYASEVEFLKQIMFKRKLTYKQQNWLEKINNRIIHQKVILERKLQKNKTVLHPNIR